MCSLLSYNNIVMVLFAGDYMHAVCIHMIAVVWVLFGLQTTHVQFVARSYVCNLTLPIRLSSSNSKIAPKPFAILKPVGFWRW